MAVDQTALKEMPLCCIHVHLPGTITYETAKQIEEVNPTIIQDIFAKNYMSRLHGSLLDRLGKTKETVTIDDLFRMDEYGEKVFNYDPGDFWSFITLFGITQNLMNNSEILKQTLWNYLEKCAENNVFYTEVMLNTKVGIFQMEFGDRTRDGTGHIEMAQILKPIIEKAALPPEQGGLGVHVRMLDIINRMRPHDFEINPKKVAEVMQQVPGVYAGIHAGGSEDVPEGRPDKLKVAYDLVRELMPGIGTAAHAGEWQGPDHVLDTIHHLGVQRITHALRAAESEEAIRALKENDVTVVVTPLMNIQLGSKYIGDQGAEVSIDEHNHPFMKLHDAGVKIAFSTDNPAMGGGWAQDVAAHVTGNYPISVKAYAESMLNAMDTSFAPPEIKAAYVQKMQDWAVAHNIDLEHPLLEMQDKAAKVNGWDIPTIIASERDFRQSSAYQHSRNGEVLLRAIQEKGAELVFNGKFARAVEYSEERELLHDILIKLISEKQNMNLQTTKAVLWQVFDNSLAAGAIEDRSVVDKVIDRYGLPNREMGEYNKRTTHMIVGPFASGKTTLMKQLSRDGVLPWRDGVLIDIDYIKQLLRNPDKPEPMNSLHTEALALAGKARDILDVKGQETGVSPDFIKPASFKLTRPANFEINHAQKGGGSFLLYGLTCDIPTAIKRNVERQETREGHLVSTKRMLEAFKGFSENLPGYIAQADEVRLFSTSNGTCEQIAEKNANAPVRVLNHDEFYKASLRGEIDVDDILKQVQRAGEPEALYKDVVLTGKHRAMLYQKYLDQGVNLEFFDLETQKTTATYSKESGLIITNADLFFDGMAPEHRDDFLNTVSEVIGHDVRAKSGGKNVFTATAGKIISNSISSDNQRTP